MLSPPLQAQDFKPVGQKVLEGFKQWLGAGAGGAPNWKLAEVNHEGWRVRRQSHC